MGDSVRKEKRIAGRRVCDRCADELLRDRERRGGWKLSVEGEARRKLGLLYRRAGEALVPELVAEVVERRALRAERARAAWESKSEEEKALVRGAGREGGKLGGRPGRNLWPGLFPAAAAGRKAEEEKRARALKGGPVESGGSGEGSSGEPDSEG